MRKNEKRLTFPNTGEEFSGIHAAEAWLRDHGYSYGSMERDRPIGVAKGEGIYISKRRLMTDEEWEALDGQIVSNDFRYDTVYVDLKEDYEVEGKVGVTIAGNAGPDLGRGLCDSGQHHSQERPALPDAERK